MPRKKQETLHSRKQQRRQSCDSTKEAGDDSFPEAAEETEP